MLLTKPYFIIKFKNFSYSWHEALLLGIFIVAFSSHNASTFKIIDL